MISKMVYFLCRVLCNCLSDLWREISHNYHWEICSRNQNCLLKPKFRIQISFNMQNSMVIFIFLVGIYAYCANLTQKFKRVILRRNLVPTLECLIDVHFPVNYLFYFFPSGASLFHPSLPPLINYWGKFSSRV